MKTSQEMKQEMLMNDRQCISCPKCQQVGTPRSSQFDIRFRSGLINAADAHQFDIRFRSGLINASDAYHGFSGAQ
jgi:hypothetical protein